MLIFLILIVLVSALIGAGCSGGERSAMYGNGNSVEAESGNRERITLPDAAAADETNVEVNSTGPKNQKLQEMRSTANGAAETPAIKEQFQAAPENSAYSVTFGEVGIERRVFKDHKFIVKIEKTLGGKNTTAKIYLRDGKIVELSGEKLQNIGTISTDQILELAGIEQAMPPIEKAPAIAVEGKKPLS